MISLCPHCGKEGLPLDITEIRRLEIGPGDRLVIQVDRDSLTPEEVQMVSHRVRKALGLDDSISIVLTTRDYYFEVERG